MSELSLQALESIASAYEERLVPALFQLWTQRMTEAARIGTGQRVLDVACGTGVLARAAAARVGPIGSVVGLDINPGMLAVAARIAPGIEWKAGAVESLPFDNQSFDVIVSQFGLMFFSDREAALREMFRVLSPGGHLAAAVFDSLDHNRAYAAMVSVYERRVGKGTADALRFPFILGDRATLLSLFTAAGIDSAAATSEETTAHFASIRDIVLADVEGWFPLAGIALDNETLAAVIGEAGVALQPFVNSGGAVEFPVRAHIVTASKA
jgi:ubiquinone/menaquinone biosynthesis C-methylase UbiE